MEINGRGTHHSKVPQQHAVAVWLCVSDAQVPCMALRPKSSQCVSHASCPRPALSKVLAAMFASPLHLGGIRGHHERAQWRNKGEGEKTLLPIPTHCVH